MSLLVAPSAFARDLARLLAGWLAAIVLVQAMASAIGAVQGPRHQHVRPAAAVFVHAADHDHDEHDLDHHHEAEHASQGGWARHVHDTASADGTVVADDAQQLGAAAGLVLASMVALGLARALCPSAAARHVMRARAAWSWRTHWVALQDRPPKA